MTWEPDPQLQKPPGGEWLVLVVAIITVLWLGYLVLSWWFEQ